MDLSPAHYYSLLLSFSLSFRRWSQEGMAGYFARSATVPVKPETMQMISILLPPSVIQALIAGKYVQPQPK